MGKNARKELNIKSKLLFNSLESHKKIVLDLSQPVEKRIKAYNKLYETYMITLNPFISDESKEFQEKMRNGIKSESDKVIEYIKDGLTVEGLNIFITPMIDSIKNMVSTCKVDLLDVKRMWRIE